MWSHTEIMNHHQSCEFEPRSWRGVLDATSCDKVCQWLATGRLFSPGTPVSSNNKTDRRDILSLLRIMRLKLIISWFKFNPITTGADPGGGGAHPTRVPPKIEKNKIFWRKIVIFHTKYPKNIRASVRTAQFF